VTGGSFGTEQRLWLSPRKGAGVVDWKKKTIDLIKKSGGEALFIKCDVSKSSDVKAMVENYCNFRPIRLCFHNAGIEGDSAPVQDCSEENWDKTIGGT
jgi:NAD(P)-dependent dehydrogenase (short-subunit alcohol dehydrogenase family)